jgi:c-di-GMP-binding flagellar brake protein YcgR
MYKGSERRRGPRVSGRFVISYHILEETQNTDITQAKDIGKGGMFLTTNRKFSPGTKLALEIRLPLDPNPMKIIGSVIESKELVANAIYETRLTFLEVDEKHKKVIDKTVDYYLKRKGK